MALRQEDGVRFIASIERLEEGGWRASFRLRVPSDVFTQEGETEVFASELQATKWLHTQAAARGFTVERMAGQMHALYGDTLATAHASRVAA